MHYFWDWFLANENRLLAATSPHDHVFDELLSQLHREHESLTYEMAFSGRPRELIISADGIREAFPSVIAITREIPALPAWRITAFRPRATELPSVKIGGLSFEPSSIDASIGDFDGRLAIFLFIPEMAEGDQRYLTAGYLYLDACLGEYDVETKVGGIKFLPKATPDYSQLTRFPLAELSMRFDEIYAEDFGKSSTR